MHHQIGVTPGTSPAHKEPDMRPVAIIFHFSIVLVIKEIICNFTTPVKAQYLLKTLRLETKNPDIRCVDR